MVPCNCSHRYMANTSPLNAAIIIEEIYRENMGKNSTFVTALLDAKLAFDVVALKILLRNLFIYGANPV